MQNKEMKMAYKAYDFDYDDDDNDMSMCVAASQNFSSTKH